MRFVPQTHKSGKPPKKVSQNTILSLETIGIDNTVKTYSNYLKAGQYR